MSGNISTVRICWAVRLRLWRSALSDHLPRILLLRRLGMSLISRYLSGYENEDRECTLRPLQTLEPSLLPPLHSPPLVHIRLSAKATRMAERNVEYNQMSVNACVPPDGRWPVTVLILTDYSSPPSESPSQSAERRCVNLFFCLVISVKTLPDTALKSPNRTKDYPSNALR